VGTRVETKEEAWKGAWGDVKGNWKRGGGVGALKRGKKLGKERGEV